MRVVSEPFLTREAVLAVLRPGEVTSERPFRTLRQRRAASPGLPVVMRSTAGQVLGRVHLYSVLNADAARAYRLGQTELAQELAARAGRLEASEAARLVHRAAAEVASRLPTDPLSAEAPPALRRYLAYRPTARWPSIDTNTLARRWLAGSDAWLATNWDALADAVVELDHGAAQARAELPGAADSVSTFYGTVERMDPISAELEAPDGQALLVPRADLERQGLAVLGQPVALLREELPGGGSYVLPMPAVALDPPTPSRAGDVWATDEDENATPIGARDMAWLRRELAREPTAVPAGPLQVS